MAVTTRAQHLTNAGQTAAEFRQQNARGLQNRAGVFRAAFDELAVAEKSGTPNMSVDVAAGACAIKASESGNTGFYLAEAPSTTNVAISASDPTNDRIDLIVAIVRDQDFASGSPSTNTFTIEAVTGTPSGSPAVPTVPDNCVVLARVDVAAAVSSIVNGDITDLRWAGYAVNPNQSNGSAAFAGGAVVCTSTARPIDPPTGLEIYETDTKEGFRFDGAVWRYLNRDRNGNFTAYAPTLTNIAATATASWAKVGQIITYRCHLVHTGAGTAGTAFVSLPETAVVTYRNMYTGASIVFDDVSSGTQYLGKIKIEAGGTTVTFWTASGAAALWTDTVPVVRAAGDVWDFTLIYEAQP